MLYDDNESAPSIINGDDDENIPHLIYDDTDSDDDENMPHIIYDDTDSEENDNMPELVDDDVDSEDEEATVCPFVWKCDTQDCSQFNICAECSKAVEEKYESDLLDCSGQVGVSMSSHIEYSSREDQEKIDKTVSTEAKRRTDIFRDMELYKVMLKRIGSISDLEIECLASLIHVKIWELVNNTEKYRLMFCHPDTLEINKYEADPRCGYKEPVTIEEAELAMSLGFPPALINRERNEKGERVFIRMRENIKKLREDARDLDFMISHQEANQFIEGRESVMPEMINHHGNILYPIPITSKSLNDILEPTGLGIQDSECFGNDDNGGCDEEDDDDICAPAIKVVNDENSRALLDSGASRSLFNSRNNFEFLRKKDTKLHTASSRVAVKEAGPIGPIKVIT